MIRTMKHVSVASALVLLFTLVAFSQQPASNTTPAPQDNYVTEKNFKSKVFDVKYREPGSLANVVSKLMSGFKGAAISSSSEFRTITVRDFPENLVTIEEAIKRLDTPAAARPDIELHIHALIASNAGSVGSAPPAELRDVLEQLRGTLNYKNYELAATVVQRLTDTPRGLNGSGVSELPGGNSGTPSSLMSYDYFIGGVSLVQNAAGSYTVQIGEFGFTTSSDKDKAKVQTAMNIRDGEKVVVGTATMRNRALVVVLTVKFLK